MKDGEIVKLLRTLLFNGYHLVNIKRIPNAAILNIYRIDFLGAQINYSLLYCEQTPSKAIKSIFSKDAKFNKSHPLFLGDFKIEGSESILLDVFLNKLGGAVNTGILLQENLSKILDELGKNRLPNGLKGEPDDLLEEYTKETLQFLLNSPARRFGQDRLFESLPDGIVIDQNKLIIQYDSKAYAKGYSVSSDDINRYASYVSNFNIKYGDFFGKIHSFLVVTGRFEQSESSLQKKSSALYAKCNTNIVYLEAKEMGEIVVFLRNNLRARSLVNWKNIFSQLIITKSLISSDLKKSSKDNLIRE